MDIFTWYIIIGCIIGANEVRLSIKENMREKGSLAFIFVVTAIIWLPLHIVSAIHFVWTRFIKK